MPSKFSGKYKCLNCNCIYRSNPGPTSCLKCGNLYVEWLNFEEYWKDLDMENIKEFSMEGEYNGSINSRKINISKRDVTRSYK